MSRKPDRRTIVNVGRVLPDALSASRRKSAREAEHADLGRNVLGGRLGFALRLTLLLALDTLEDLFPMDGNALRCIDTNCT